MAVPIDPTDPPSQADPEAERAEDLEHEIDGARDQVARHDRTRDEPRSPDENARAEGREHQDHDLEEDAAAAP